MSTRTATPKDKCWARRGEVLLLALLVGWAAPGHANAPIGQVQLAHGGAVAEQAGSAARILGRGADILLGDALTTETKSFLVIRLDDDSRLTLRPASRLTIEAYSSVAGEENAQLYLERGGLQAQSGRISREGKGNYRLRTPHGEMELHGARFNARLCEGDCEEPEPVDVAELARREQPTQLAARVVKIRGQAHAEAAGEQHPLIKGSPLYPGDTVVTGSGSNLAMAFRDGGRISLIEQTRFAIQHYQYRARPDQPETQGKASYRLLKGGLRALTGYIGKGRAEDYELETPVTTIGVRGTGFDSICLGDCLAEAATSARGPGGHYQEGLYNRVWADAISQQLPIGAYELRQGQAAYLPNPDTPPIALPTLPPFLQNPGAARPDSLEVDMKELFGARTLQGQPAGLYVYLDAGFARLSDGREGLDLGRGESGYSGPQGLFRLERPKSFQIADPYPQPWQSMENLRRLYSPLQDDATLVTEFACKVK